MEVLKVRLREFGSVLDLRQDRYAGAIAGMIPCLTGQITVRMTLSAAIPSYLQVGEFKVYVRYSNQPITCRECNLTGHMATACPQKLMKIPPAASKPSSGKGPMAPKVVAKKLASEIVPVLSNENFPPLSSSETDQWRQVTGRNKSQPCWRDDSFLIPETPASESETMPSVNPSIIPETPEATPRDALTLPESTPGGGASDQHLPSDSASEVDDHISEPHLGSDRDPQGPVKCRRTRTRKAKLNHE